VHGLLPKEAALKAAYDGLTNEQVAVQYDVSPEMARWRLNATGARKRAASAWAKTKRAVGWR
jgi:hypothetical protein